jgi:hypothetical protein
MLHIFLNNTANGPVLSPVTLEPIKNTTLTPVEPIRHMVAELVETKLQKLRATNP